ncbi:hypothetical protein ABRC46_001963 [Salmonella enterica]|nr:hypothetical protein [Salmonella enterica]EGP6830222.1 hypothetical protein [Salmonella enterica]EGS4698234.1 hypothetical protein [Salmonella enterica]EIJ8349266.1 hypothetical protein [Salmonella enterica]EIX3948892.1 hypothetical protein [Salmonella enterica]
MRNRSIISCDNRRIQEQMTQVGEAIARLNAMDFTVDRVEMDGYQRPDIRVHYNTRCRQEQEQGKAVRYGTGNDDKGNYEWWQIQVNNCRVLWEVR